MVTRRFEGPAQLPAGPYQRFSNRFEPTRRDACLAWWDESDDGTAHQDFALLLDISRGGALLATDRIPGTFANVWLRLDGEPSTHWAEAEVVDVTPTAIGPHLVRLAFRGPSSFEILRNSVCG